ncbi:MAG: Zn-dependent alcohol dehydrogenase [Rhodobacter sp.]|nr:Zn-dependent alcohol dehydrogenase [Rhodobacter sp.]
MKTVKAAVCRGFVVPLAIEEIELAAPGPREALVELAACAICHSDITFAEGGWGGHIPAVYGHEAAGIVAAVGTNVDTFAIGDAVLVSLLRSCETCSSCLSGRPATCTRSFDTVSHPLSKDGEPIEQGMGTGAFAEAVVVDRTQIVKIPADIPMDAAALLSCGVITGIDAVVNTAKLRPGQTCIVIGAGGVGLNAIQGARIAEASRIFAVDMKQEKLQTAMEFGATDGVLATDPKPWSTARRILGGGADFVFVTVGDVNAYDTSVRYLGTHGKTVMVGMTHNGESSSYQPADFAALAQGMIGSKMGDTVLGRDIPWMVDLYRQGRLKLDELVSRRWPLDEINDAIADTRTGAAKRNVIIFRNRAALF